MKQCNKRGDSRMKYTKGINLGKYKLNILITNKDSFEECDKELIEEINRHSEIPDLEKVEIIKEALI